MKNISTKLTTLFLLIIITVSFLGCGKQEIIEDNQKDEVVEVVEDKQETANTEENNDSLEDFNDELVTITTEEIDEDFELKAKMDTSDWLTYKNEEYGFEVKYPRGGEVHEWYGDPKTDKEGAVVGLGVYTQGRNPGGATWGIDIENYSLQMLKNKVAEIGSQFSDRKEIRKKVNFQGYEAVLVKVSTDECCSDFKWRFTDLLVKKNDYLLIIGDVDNEYVNFKFIK